jgi:hypothetical protein
MVEQRSLLISSGLFGVLILTIIIALAKLFGAF